MHIARPHHSIWLALSLLLLLGACSTAPAGPPTTTPPAAATTTVAATPPPAGATPAATELATVVAAPSATSMPGEVPIDTGDAKHLILEVEGNVSFRRAEWPEAFSSRAVAGMLLDQDDFVQVESGARLLIMCDNWNVKYILDAQSRLLNHCPEPSRSLVTIGGRETVAPRGPDPQIPYLLRPRATNLLEVPRELHWHDTGAGPYDLEIIDENGTAIFTASDIVAPPYRFTEPPALQPEQLYLLIVTDSEGKSSLDEQGNDLRFQILGATAAAEVMAVAMTIEQELQANVVADDIIDLAIAYRFISAELFDPAHQRLLSHAATSREPLIHLLIAELYARSGLSDEADEYFRQAATLAQDRASRELEARIAYGSGRVAMSRNEDAQAIAAFEFARDFYAEIGDSEQVAALDALIQSLQ